MRCNTYYMMMLILVSLVITLTGCGGSATPKEAKTNSKSVSSTTFGSNIFMANGGDTLAVSKSGTFVYGGTGYDTVTINAGVTLDQNIEQINLTDASTSYAFKQTGNLLNVYDASGTTPIVSVPVRGLSLIHISEPTRPY